MKVIFLDIDGVLITRAACMKGYGQVAPRCVRNLNQLTDETGAGIVLSSCWRLGRTLVQCRELLRNWGVRGTVVDKTPHCPQGVRGTEIIQWLNTYPGDIDGLVILDDDSDMSTLLLHLVQTRFKRGLTRVDVRKAKEIVNTQISRRDGAARDLIPTSRIPVATLEDAGYPRTAGSGFESLAALHGGSV